MKAGAMATATDKVMSAAPATALAAETAETADSGMDQVTVTVKEAAVTVTAEDSAMTAATATDLGGDS